MPQGDKSSYTDKQKRKAEHRGKLREARYLEGRGRAPRLGDRQQDDRRRQEKRFRAWQAHQQRACQARWEKRRRRLGQPLRDGNAFMRRRCISSAITEMPTPPIRDAVRVK